MRLGFQVSYTYSRHATCVESVEKAARSNSNVYSSKSYGFTFSPWDGIHFRIYSEIGRGFTKRNLCISYVSQRNCLENHGTQLDERIDDMTDFGSKTRLESVVLINEMSNFCAVGSESNRGEARRGRRFI